MLLCNSEAVPPQFNWSNSEKVTRHLQVYHPMQREAVAWARRAGRGEELKGGGGPFSNRRQRSTPWELWNSTRLCEQGRVHPGCSVNACKWPQAPHSPRLASRILHARLTLKITPVLALLPGRLDYRITFSPPGGATGNPLSSLCLGINNQ